MPAQHRQRQALCRSTGPARRHLQLRAMGRKRGVSRSPLDILHNPDSLAIDGSFDDAMSPAIGRCTPQNGTSSGIIFPQVVMTCTNFPSLQSSCQHDARCAFQRIVGSKSCSENPIQSFLSPLFTRFKTPRSGWSHTALRVMTKKV